MTPFPFDDYLVQINCIRHLSPHTKYTNPIQTVKPQKMFITCLLDQRDIQNIQQPTNIHPIELVSRYKEIKGISVR